MAPPKKSKKAKRESKKSKKCKSMSVVPIEPRATESDWWDSFWQKNSPIPGFIFGSVTHHPPIASNLIWEKLQICQISFKGIRIIRLFLVVRALILVSLTLIVFFYFCFIAQSPCFVWFLNNAGKEEKLLFWNSYFWVFGSVEKKQCSVQLSFISINLT